MDIGFAIDSYAGDACRGSVECHAGRPSRQRGLQQLLAEHMADVEKKTPLAPASEAPAASAAPALPTIYQLTHSDMADDMFVLLAAEPTSEATEAIQWLMHYFNYDGSYYDDYHS